VSFIPEGYHSITPYLIVNDALKALAFYRDAFGATEVLRLADPQGKIMHCEFQVGNSKIMMAEGCEEMGALDPHTIGGSPVSLCLYVEKVDEIFQQALAAGATEKRGVQDQFYGDRSGTLEDPFGHTWTVATHIEDLTQEQVDQRFAEWMQQHGGQ
ncbi:MAG: VOC family protein, partial [Planctomycetaceae bacterium]|nr:VOC family protein [Planctomycetaceae bacterium]